MDSSWSNRYRNMQITSQTQKWTSYHACRTDTAEKVVMKIICLSDLNAKEADTLAWSYSYLERLSNKCIVKCSVIRYTPQECLVLESPFEDGYNLTEYIAHSSPSCGMVSEEILWPVLFQVSMGLAYLHTPTDKGVVLHRNLTPRNILLLPDGTIKLSDIWLGQVLNIGPGSNDTTPFRAPELRSWGSFSAKADIYSLGCIIAQLCIDNNSPTDDKITRATLESRGYTSVFTTLILACLNLDPGKRPTAWDIVEQSAIISEMRAIKLCAHAVVSKVHDTQTSTAFKYSDTKTSLMLAAERGSLIGVQTLLYEAGTVWSGPRELPGTETIVATAASLSLLHGHKECFSLLVKLEVGLADLTPLMLYATGIVDLPLDPTALETLCNTYGGARCMGVSALMIAIMYNNHGLFPLLRKELLLLDNNERSVLLYLKHAKIATRIALLHVIDEENIQLHPLSRQLIINDKITFSLIENNSDLWTLDNMGGCPFLYAIVFNNLDAVQSLLSLSREKSCPPDDILGLALNTVLDLHDADKVLEELIIYLNKYTITIAVRRRYGTITPIKTELMHAAERGDEIEIHKYIHKMGKNAMGLDGGTALICAASRGHVRCCSLLYKEIGMLDKHGRTALDYAKEKGHSECVYLLRHEYNLSKK